MQLIAHSCLPNLPIHRLSKVYCNYKVNSCVFPTICGHVYSDEKFELPYVYMFLREVLKGCLASFHLSFCKRTSFASSHRHDPIFPIFVHFGSALAVSNGPQFSINLCLVLLTSRSCEESYAENVYKMRSFSGLNYSTFSTNFNTHESNIHFFFFQKKSILKWKHTHMKDLDWQ